LCKQQATVKESKKMEIDATLKPAEYKRNHLGQFDRLGKTMSNAQKPNKKRAKLLKSK